MNICVFQRGGLRDPLDLGISVGDRDIVLIRDYPPWMAAVPRKEIERIKRGLKQIASIIANERAAWAAEFRAMADRYDSVATEPAYQSTLAATLREAAESPPDCEDAFRFRLCLLLDWHPRLNRADLDAAVERARVRKVTS